MAKNPISSQKSRVAIAAAVVATMITAPAAAQGGVDIPAVTSGGPKRVLYPMALVGGTDKIASKARKSLEFDLNVSGWFRAVTNIDDETGAQKLVIDPTYWKSKGVFGVVKYQVKTTGSGVAVDLRLFEIEKGANPVLSRSYQGKVKDIRKFAHLFAGDVVRYHTKEDNFFQSQLAFSIKQGKTKQIVVMDHDGENSRTITRNRSLNILPNWSPSGKTISFTSYMRRNPDLYTVSATGGRPRTLSRRQGMNTGGRYSPDGSLIALTLSRDGNPEIYIIKASNGAILRRLTDSPAIDTSPSWSPDGKEIAFVSDRQGGPQIFVMSASGGGAKRVSFNGNYNTTPVWSPRKGKRILAYTTRDKGKYDIVTLDLDNKSMKRITQRQGNNEEPTWAPNGRAIAFVSRRKGGTGVYVSNAEGTSKQYLIYRGAVGSVSWGPQR